MSVIDLSRADPRTLIGKGRVGLLDSTGSYDVDRYAWAYEFWKRQQQTHWMGEEVPLTVSAAADLWSIYADPGQIEQVIMNLAANARDAISGAGRLTIAIDNVALTEQNTTGTAQVPPGKYVRLSVQDTGTGMTEATQARVFEPFFTTKAVGKGTGLGLATVYGIVRQSDGFVLVSSELGKGTTFEIYFPAVTPDQRADS